MTDHSDRRRSWTRSLMILVGIAVLLPIAWEILLSVRWGVHLSEHQVSPKDRQALTKLALAALDGKDVPVGAVLIYGDSIIGRGFNTVVAEGNAGGHAEVNALSDALRRLGDERFSSLDRDSLALISTYEPCTMCTGALMNFGIKRVSFLKTKSVFDRLQEDYRLMFYRFRMEQQGAGELQDSLFKIAWSRHR